MCKPIYLSGPPPGNVDQYRHQRWSMHQRTGSIKYWGPCLAPCASLMKMTHRLLHCNQLKGEWGKNEVGKKVIKESYARAKVCTTLSMIAKDIASTSVYLASQGGGGGAQKSITIVGQRYCCIQKHMWSEYLGLGLYQAAIVKYGEGGGQESMRIKGGVASYSWGVISSEI